MIEVHKRSIMKVEELGKANLAVLSFFRISSVGCDHLLVKIRNDCLLPRHLYVRNIYKILVR